MIQTRRHVVFTALGLTLLLGSASSLRAQAELQRHTVEADGHPIAVWEKSPENPEGTIVLVHGRTWSSLPDFDLQVPGEDLSLMDGLVAEGFATYAVIRALGREGIAEMVARHCACARRIGERLAAAEGVSVMNEVTLNQVVARFGAGLGDEASDRLTRAVVARVQASGVCMLGGSEWRGRQVLRVSVSGARTTLHDMDLSADAILAAWCAIRDEEASGA